LQRQQLAAPQACRQIQQEQFIISLGFRLNEKPLQFIPRQHLHLACLFWRQLAALGGIGADKSILYSPLERRAAGRVAHPHHAVGQSLAVALRARLASALFEPRVKLLQVVLCQPVQRNFTQLRLDVQADAVFIAGLRRGADIRLAVRFVPIIQPVGKAHLRPQLVRRNAAELRFERCQLFRALSLALAKDCLCFRVAMIVIADNVPPLPAPVCTLTDQSVACFSLLCQGFSSFPNRSSMKPPTMPPAASRISGVTCV